MCGGSIWYVTYASPDHVDHCQIHFLATPSVLLCGCAGHAGVGARVLVRTVQRLY